MMKKTIIMRESLEASWFFISTLTKSGYKLFTGSLYAMINSLTELLSVKDTGSFAGLRNSLKITRYNTTTVFAWIAL